MSQTRVEFMMRLREKYPQYNDIPSDELFNRVITKYPQYRSDIVDIDGEDKSITEPPDPSQPTSGMLGADKLFGGMGEGFVQGVKKAGIGSAEFVNRLMSQLQTGVKPGPNGEPVMSTVMDYTPEHAASYREQRAEQEAGDGLPQRIGRFAGEALPAALTMRAPQGLIPRAIVDTAAGALQGEIAEPGQGPLGAALGLGGSAVGGVLSPRTGWGRDIAERQASKSTDEMIKVLSPGGDPDAIRAAEQAVPWMRSEGVVAPGLNPFANTTGKLLKRAEAAQASRGTKLNAAFDAADASGQRMDLEPVKQGLQGAQSKIAVPGTQTQPGTIVSVSLNDILDRGGNIDAALARNIGLEGDDVAALMKGAARGGVDTIDIQLPYEAVHQAGRQRYNALVSQERHLGRTEAQARLAEAGRTGSELADIPLGLKPSQARNVRQQLDTGKYKGVVHTSSTAAKSGAESEAGNLMRHELNRQFSGIAEQNEPFHHLSTAVDLLRDKALKQKAGNLGDKYAAVRAAAGLLRGLMGGVSLAAANSAINSSAYHAINSNVRLSISKAIASGNLDLAARLLSRYAETEIGSDSPNQQR